ncbi:MAG: triose-phosphate isomerase [Eubacteriales bacterium]|nr:triose-phosphate isomerase [Eubacteriales bacterium]
MRKPIIAGNWKLNKTVGESVSFTEELKTSICTMDENSLPEVVIAPVFTALVSVSEILSCDCIKLAAQNCYWEASGAFTGEVSVDILKDLGCSYIIIGHSERRQYFSETDEMINKKAKAILAADIIPIICCGETLEQREEGLTDSHIASQIKAALEGISKEDIARSVIAYEPIWAIGTGKTCDSIEANRVIKMIRNVVEEVSGKASADAIRILYGGSVKPSTIEEQMTQSDIDGALVGGASLKVSDFAGIIEGCIKAQTVCEA